MAKRKKKGTLKGMQSDVLSLTTGGVAGSVGVRTIGAVGKGLGATAHAQAGVGSVMSQQGLLGQITVSGRLMQATQEYLGQYPAKKRLTRKKWR